LALVLAEGNYKDEASVVAAEACIAAFADEFDRGLISEADVAPALRRAVLAAHESSWVLSGEDIPAGLFSTVMGPRKDLRGIGASVVAAFLTSAGAWVVSIGECPAWVVREGRASRLNHPHTLANDPAYRAAVRRDPSQAIEFADSVVTKVLGLTLEPPAFDVTRLELRSRDLVVLGNDWLSPHAARVASGGTGCAALEFCNALAAAVEQEPAPMPVAVLVGERR
jgi:serine/threonine protein phosphatase PrpC